MKQARSFKKQNLKSGGKADGLAHEEGGVKAKTSSGEPIAEIEVDERVFSKEDTSFIEGEVQKIMKYTESGDYEGADNCAKDLGYAVYKMVSKQDANEARREDENQAINSFSNGEYDG